jgi:hypothetical protein
VISNSVVRKVVQVEYALVRTPLAVLDRRVLTRLDEGSRIRLSFERGLQTLDAAAGRLFQAPKSAARETPDPFQTPTAAAPETPDAFAVTDPPVDVAVDEVERVADEILADQDEKPMVGELADPDLQEVQAQLRAKHLLEEQAEEQRLKEEHEERVKAANAAGPPAAKRAPAAKKAPAKKAPAKRPPSGV